MRYTDDMAVRAEKALLDRYPGMVDPQLLVGIVQTVLMAATSSDHEQIKQRLDVTAVSAALPPDTEQIEFLLVGSAGRFWEFELGPVASGSLVLLLTEALEDVERRTTPPEPPTRIH